MRKLHSTAISIIVCTSLLALSLAQGPTFLAHADEHQGRHNVPRGDIDKDGVPNREDSDMDGDGLTNEYETNTTLTNPRRWDSDGDGLSDAEELIGGGLIGGQPINPTDPNDDDSDNDGWADAAEVRYGSDPNNPESTPTQGNIIQQD